MNEKFVFWYKIVVKWFIPVSFFVIANITAATNQVVGNSIAGVMLILTLFYYLTLTIKKPEDLKK